jgi:hypothetical protein
MRETTPALSLQKLFLTAIPSPWYKNDNLFALHITTVQTEQAMNYQPIVCGAGPFLAAGYFIPVGQ